MPLSCLSWNVNGAVFCGPTEQGGNTLSEGIDYIIQTLKRVQADIVALQEIPCGSEERPILDAALSYLSSLYPNVLIEPLSPSHVRPGGKLGLALLSKHPLRDSHLAILPRPSINYVAEDGHIEELHDKGVLTANVQAPTGTFRALVAHLHPFKGQRRRPGEPIFDAVRTSFRTILEQAMSAPLVLCADLNMDSLDEILPEWAERAKLVSAISVPTHWVNGLLVKNRSQNRAC